MVLPPSMQSSLPAGWLAFTGRESNPLDRYKRFQIAVSSSFSGFILAQGKFHFEPPSCFTSLDHLVGAGRERGWDFHAEDLCGLQIEDEFELRGLLNWQIGGLCAFENASGIDADLTIDVETICAIAHQSACFHPVAPLKHGGNGMPGRLCNDLNQAGGKHAVGNDDEPARFALHQLGESLVDFLAVPGIEN